MGPSELEELRRELERRTREVGVLERFAVALGGTLELDALLDTILASMDTEFGFAHAMVLLLETSSDVLRVAASRGYPESGVGAVVRVGDGLIGVVAKRKKLLRMGGLTRQRGYATAARDHMEGGATEIALPGLERAQSVVGIPLLGKDQLLGVFAVESDRAAAFDDADQELIEAVASQAALAIHNALLLRSERERRAELEQANARLTTWNEASRRFVPFEFLEILGRRELPDIQRGDSAHKLMSAFFSDIRGYTTIVESQGAHENFRFINEYLESMEAPIRAHAGIVESYHGDGIMALFGGPPDDAVRAAAESLTALAEYNKTARQGAPPLRIGIGIDTGWLMLGTMGSAGRMAASVIGDCANTASRVENATKLYGATILITTRTKDGLADAAAWHLRAVDNVRPRGQHQPVTLYEVLDGLPEQELTAKRASLPAFEEGWSLYQGGRPGDALVHFAEALRLAPTDRAAQLYVGRCWHLIERGVPDGWDGVMDLQS